VVAPSGLQKALALAQQADHIILTLGITPGLEGEEKRGLKLDGFEGGDRTSVMLPKTQMELLEKVSELGKPVVVILNNGSALSFDTSKANAILETWYYGQRGGDAIAEALLGETNPGGRLPVTFYAADSDLPSFTDYSMKNRTYRYFTGKPLYAFGHGLSYTTFGYGEPKLSKDTATVGESVDISVAVTNTGKRSGDEVVQVYAHAVKPTVEMPKEWLVGFQRVPIQPGESKTVTIPIKVQSLRRWDEKSNRYVVDPGSYELRVGSASDDIRGATTLSVSSPSN
jgi:beta-glucosidase